MTMTFTDLHGAAPRAAAAAPGVASGVPRLMLQAEGAAVLAVATTAYALTGSGWGLFVALFLVPDLFMLGYLRGPRTGAAVYNIGHTYVVALALVALGWFAAAPLAVSVGLIWVAHIGFDRMMGYGLKYGRGFKATHLSDGEAV